MVAADPNGTTLRRLTHSINLEPGVLRSLLDALVGAGLLTAAEENGVLVFRAPRRSP